MRAISEEGMDVSISDPEVRAPLIGTGEAFGGYPLRCSPAAFHLTPGSHRLRCRPHNRCVGARETAGGTLKWSAWFEETVD